MTDMPAQLRNHGIACQSITWPEIGYPDLPDNRWTLAEWTDSEGDLFSGWLAMPEDFARAWINQNFHMIICAYDANPNAGDIAAIPGRAKP